MLVLIDCFESQNFDTCWDSHSSGAEYSGTQKHHGSYAFKCSATSPASELLTKNIAQQDYFAHFYVYLTDLTTFTVGKTAILAEILSSDGSTPLVGLGIERDDTHIYFSIFYYDGTSVCHSDAGVEPALGQWFEIKLYYAKSSVGGGADGKVQLWIDGTKKNEYFVDNDAKTVTKFRLGHRDWAGAMSGTYCYYFDCFQLSTTNITADNCRSCSATEIRLGDISIGATSCERIMDFGFGDSVDFAVKPILAKKAPTIEGGIYIVHPKIFKIMARVAVAKRNLLQDRKDSHITLTLVYDTDVVDYVKFEEFEYRWAGQEEHTCDWLITLTLTSTQIG